MYKNNKVGTFVKDKISLKLKQKEYQFDSLKKEWFQKKRLSTSLGILYVGTNNYLNFLVGFR